MYQIQRVARRVRILARCYQPAIGSWQASRGYASGSEPYDVVVIGGGPGGYVAAIKAAQMGLKTACVEKRGSLGGTCLNVGCIPSKAMLNNSHLYHQAQHDFKKRGIDVDNVSLNLPQMLKAKEDAVNGLTKGIEFLFKQNKVGLHQGSCIFRVQPPRSPLTCLDGSKSEVDAKNLSLPLVPMLQPSPVVESPSTRSRLSAQLVRWRCRRSPEKMVVIGEMGSVWSRLGAEVTVVEFLGAIGGVGIDEEVSKQFQRLSKLNTKVVSAEKVDGKVQLKAESAKGGKEETIEADVTLHTDGLNIEAAGIEKDDKGRIIIDDQFTTSVKNIKCIGDVTFGPMLAHKAEEEALVTVHVNYGAIPSVVYTHPEVAWVGQTEQDLKKAGVQYNIGKFSFSANSRAKTNLDADGFVKFIAEKETDKILGIHIIGPNAGEMIAEGGPCHGIWTCHAHPTLSEAFKEAAMAAHSKPIPHSCLCMI
ncbi:dihydrolipoamide dehydrogenase [Coprinopsis sp. MPI-PUGE-AT-0042]|nr:dihydrolipoamide dehydrogenase [Coprinopsis sp. MPI-PUGE-AT-0042]